MGNSVLSTLNKHRKRESYFSKPKETITKTKNEETRNEEQKQQLKYFLPNVVEDADVMVMGHFLSRYLFQGIFSAPINDKLVQEDSKILDVGCGAGIWLLELASTYNSPKFFGVDLFSIYPTGVKPDNIEFIQADILKGLPFDDNTFDYVHQSNMATVLTVNEWDFIIRELIRVCKPGGYIEFVEPELATNSGPMLAKFYDGFIQLNESRNVKVRISKDIIRILESSAMLQNVDHKISAVPLGAKRGGNPGQTYMDIHELFFSNEPMPENMCKYMGISKEEYLELFKEAKNEVENGISPDCCVCRIWCQKA